MKNADFNEEALRPRYSFRREPGEGVCFSVLRWNEAADRYDPFGDYRVLDSREDPEVSEKRVVNLIGALNERRKLKDIGADTKSRTLFKADEQKDERGRSKVVFYTFTGEGVSKENAVFTYEGDANDNV